MRFFRNVESEFTSWQRANIGALKLFFQDFKHCIQDVFHKKSPNVVIIKNRPNVEVTGAARLYRAASVLTAVLGFLSKTFRNQFCWPVDR